MNKPQSQSCLVTCNREKTAELKKTKFPEKKTPVTKSDLPREQKFLKIYKLSSKQPKKNSR